MHNAAIELFLVFYLLNSIYSIIIINITSKKSSNTYFKIIEQTSNLDLYIKVNNETVNPDIDGVYIFFQIEPGETEIIINANLTSLEELFAYNRQIESIKIKTIEEKITNVQNMFFLSQFLMSIDLSEFDLTEVTNFNSFFRECGSLVSIKFGNYKTINAIDLASMFYKCYSLVSLDLSIFNTFNVINMARLFYYCNSLISINLKHFNLHKVKDFSYMFSYCESLTSLDLSNFVTLEANNMEGMFFGCKSLKSLELNSFITLKVELMGYMFMNCQTLIDLKINNFDTSNVIDMSYMFCNCRFLTSLNISNFNGNSVINTNEMFSGCASLKSLDIQNFKPNKILSMSYMFYSCFNLKFLNLSNFNTSLTTNMNSMFYGCKSLSYLNINNFNTKNVEDMTDMFRDCFSLTSLNLSNFEISDNAKFENIFNGISKNLIYCANDEVYEKIESYMNKIECAIRDKNCIPDWHVTSKKIINDNGTCIVNCSITDNFKYEYENKCYSSCPEGTTSFYNNKFLCEIFRDEKLKEFLSNNKDIKTNKITEIFETSQNLEDNKIIEEYKTNTNNFNENNMLETPKICGANDFFMSRCISFKYNSMVKIIIEDINDGLMDDKINDDVIKNKIDIYQMDNNIKYQITSSFNQRNKIYDNISIIDLKECETKLKDIYEIPKNITLIIFKFDYILEEILVPIVGYEVFNPITKKILDLNHCQNIKIDIILPVSIRDNELYKHDPNSNYYKDKCNSFPNDKGVDMSLYERKKNYNDNNLALCYDNCNYINYKNDTNKVLCLCEPKFNSSLITLDKIINGKKILHNFINIKKFTNIGVIKCFKKFMSLKGFIHNIGSYIILFIFFIYVVGLVILIIKENKLLEKIIDKIITNYKKEKQLKHLISTGNPIKKNLLVNKTIKNKMKKSINSLKDNKITNLINSTNFLNNQFKSIKKINNIKLENKIEKFSEIELNIYDFSIAQKNDKRGYIECYISLVKTRHPLISSFLFNDEYNSRSIKICLLFFSFALNFIVNSLFFSDETMHKIVEDEGIFNFVYNLPITIYSTIISFVFNIIIKKLALSENAILEIRNEKKLEKMVRKAKETKKYLTIKFILFFIISFISLFIFWFYIGCFCAVYTNTQIYLIKDTLIIFALSMISPFIIYILVCIIRKKSLNKPGQCLYKISQILQ